MSGSQDHPCPFEFCTVIDNLKEIVFRTDRRGILTFLSPAWETITGFGVAEGLGRSLLEYVHPDDRQAQVECFRDFLARKAGHSHQEFRHLLKDGGFRWVELQTSLVFDAQGTFEGTCGTIADITAHRVALETLSSTQAKLQFVLDSGPAVIFTADPDRDYAVTWVSENIFALLGYPASQFLQNRHLWRDIIAVEDRDAVQTFNRNLSMGGTGVIRHRVRIASGEIRWVRMEMKLNAGALGGPPQAIGCLIDVTEAMEALESLKRRDSMRQALSFAAERFLRGDEWESVLPAAIERLGETAGATRIAVIQKVHDARGQTSLEIRHEWWGRKVQGIGGQPAPILESWEKRFECGEAIVGVRTDFPESERELLKKKGIGSIAMIPIFVESSYWGMVCFVRQMEQHWQDETLEMLRITAGIIGAGIQQSLARQRLRQAHLELENRVYQRTLQLAESNRALRESEQLFHVVFDEAPIGIAVLGDGDRFRATNRSFRRMLGYSAEEFNELTEPDITHPDDIADATGNLSRRSHQSEKRYVSKSGVEIWARATVASLSPLGKESLVVAMIEDVTGRKQLEDQFRQAQKMEAIGRLAGGIAHDFNNLLTVIKGFGELLLKHVTSNTAARVKTEEILKATERAATLVQQLLAFSRKQIVQPTIVELNAAIREMNSMLLRLVGEDIEFSTDLDPMAGFIRIDATQLAQLLMNLTVNARDAMQSGGSLTITTQFLMVESGTAPPCAEMAPGRYAVLDVRDTGTGMDEETQSRIFEPFFTTKEVGKGTGLGLSTVYGIVGQADGYITVESVPGRGSTFRVYFPALSPLSPRHSSSPEQSVKPAPSDGKETILLTEDEDSVRTLIAQALSSRGYTVLEARNGRHALELAAQHLGQIDLLLTDVVMPQMSGPEVWEKLAPCFPEMRLLYMSGHTERVLPPGCALLTKPFSVETLTAKVREVIDTPISNLQLELPAEPQ